MANSVHNAGLLLMVAVCLTTGHNFRTRLTGVQNCTRLTDWVFACRGGWHGHVSNASSVCPTGFHVCSPRDRHHLRQLTAIDVIEILTKVDDCYAYNASQNYGCYECTGESHKNEMAGFGRGCQEQSSTTGPENSCLGSGRVVHDDGSKKGRTPCTFEQGRTTGAVCCREETTEAPATYRGPFPLGYLKSGKANDILQQRSTTPSPSPPSTTQPLRNQWKKYLNGCRHRNRNGLFHLKYVAPCKGLWNGHVKLARKKICAPGWTVCNKRHSWMLHDITFNVSYNISSPHALPGCYALNMAHNINSECVPCRKADPPVLMAGVGAECFGKHTSRKLYSCFMTGRVDALRHGLQSAHECTHHHGLLDGVLCCKKKAVKPCSGLKDCSGNGHCNTSVNASGVCVCQPGMTGRDCSQGICTRRCANGGSCIGPNFCRCAPGWRGKTCKIAICKGASTCAPAGGVCIKPNRCRCFDHFTGPQCRTKLYPTRKRRDLP